MKRHRSILTLLTAAAMLAAAPAFAVDVTPTAPNSAPESLAAGPDGTLYIGSQAGSMIYRARPGETTASLFIDMKDQGAFILGVLADGATNTLWACEMLSMDRSTPMLRGKGVLRSFDLGTGAAKASLPLPEATNICNDFVVGPDKALYVTDTSNGKILRLRPGTAAFEPVIQNTALYGIDGIAFLDGAIYVNTVWSNALFRIPMDAAGKAGPVQQLLVPVLLKSPDGMRAAGGKLYLAENTGGQVDELTISGDRVTVRVIKNGLMGPTAVEPHGDTLWIADRPAHKAVSVPLK